MLESVACPELRDISRSTPLLFPLLRVPAIGRGGSTSSCPWALLLSDPVACRASVRLHTWLPPPSTDRLARLFFWRAWQSSSPVPLCCVRGRPTCSPSFVAGIATPRMLLALQACRQDASGSPISCDVGVAAGPCTGPAWHWQATARASSVDRAFLPATVEYRATATGLSCVVAPRIEPIDLGPWAETPPGARFAPSNAALSRRAETNEKVHFEPKIPRGLVSSTKACAHSLHSFLGYSAALAVMPFLRSLGSRPLSSIA